MDERKLKRRKQMSTRRHTYSIQHTVVPLFRCHANANLSDTYEELEKEDTIIATA